jgi:hypothetical protein
MEIFEIQEAEKYEPHVGPLTELEIKSPRKDVANLFPRGKLLSKSALFQPPPIPGEHDLVVLLVEHSGVPLLTVGTGGVVVHLH